MAKKRKQTADETKPAPPRDMSPITLTAALSRPAQYRDFSLWAIGDTPLICHAWSEKARLEMLQKQVKSTRTGKQVRDPQADYLSSLYDMGDGSYGFPVTGFKKAILSVAHKDKGVPRTEARGALWFVSQMVKTRPALAGAVCDMPLIRIYGAEPQMREDMVRVGVGMTKTANLAYRAQFWPWAFRLKGRFNADVLTPEQLSFLIQEAGLACGVGDWRNEKDGVFGGFHLALTSEARAWEKFLTGGEKGQPPLPESYAEAA